MIVTREIKLIWIGWEPGRYTIAIRIECQRVNNPGDVCTKSGFAIDLPQSIALFVIW